MYGNPETQPGGRALKFYASMRLDMRAIGKPEQDYRMTRVKVVKNKLAPPYREAEIKIIYGKGIDGADETFKLAVEAGVIQTTGRGWFTMPRLDCPGIKIIEADIELKFHGEEDARIFINQTAGYFEALQEAVTLTFKNTGVEEDE
jgi:hypothetical protein